MMRSFVAVPVSCLNLLVQTPVALGFAPPRIQPRVVWKNNNLSTHALTFVRPLSSTRTFDQQVTTSHQIEAWDDGVIYKAKGSIWFHLNKDRARDATDRALELLEDLMDQEAVQGKSLLEAGIAFNVLKRCSRQKVSKEDSLDRIVRVVKKIHETGRFWSPKILQFGLGTLCRSSKSGLQRAERLLNEFWETDTDKPNQIHYSTVIQGYAKTGRSRQAEELLATMEERYAKGQVDKEPLGGAGYTHVLVALAKSRDKNAPQQAESIMKRAERYPQFQPTIATYTSLLHCYAKFGLAKKADELLKKLEQKYEEGEEGPSTISYVVLVDAWANSNQTEAPERAVAVFNRMLELKNNGREDINPETTAIAILNCFVNHRRLNEAYDFIERLHQLHNAGELENGPTTDEYNLFLNAVAKSGARDAGSRAHEIVKTMDKLYNSGTHPELKPDEGTYSLVIHCYAKARMGKEAVGVLMHMHDLHNAGVLQRGPDTMSYSCALDALAKSEDPEAPEQAKTIMYRMQLFAASNPELQPNVITYNTFIYLMCKSRNFSDAEEALAEMNKLRERGDLKDGPNTLSYGTIVRALADTGEPPKLVQAEKLLSEMVDLYAEGRPNMSSPGERIFTLVLKGYAKAGMATAAEKLLDKMQSLFTEGKLDFPPNGIHYSCVMNALSQCRDWNTPERGEALLARMLEHPDFNPKLVTYNSLLRIYANEGMASNAEDLLAKIHDLAESGDLDLSPDMSSYRYCMVALAKNGGRGCHKKAEALLRKMITLHAEGKGFPELDENIKRNFLACFEKCGKLEEGAQILESLR